MFSGWTSSQTSKSTAKDYGDKGAIFMANDFIPLRHNYYALYVGNNTYFVFHSFNGEPFYLAEEDFQLLQNDELIIENIEYNDSVKEICIQKTDQYISNYHCPYVLDFIISETCNLGCHMCFHSTSLSHCDVRKQKSELSMELALKWLNYYIDLVRKNDLDIYSFHFGAAEPFIYKQQLWEIVKRIYQKATDRPVELFINTNLTLLEDKDVELISKYGIRVAVGVDGLFEINDKIRYYKHNGKGTFNVIIRNIKKLIDANVQVGVNITLTDRNFNLINPVEIVRYFYDLGIKHLLIDSDMVTHISYTSKDIVNMYMEVLKEGERLGMEINGSWRTPYDMLVFENDYIPKSFCASQLGKNLAITPSGGLSFCTYSSQILAKDCLENDINVTYNQFIDKMKNLMKKILPGKVEECEGCPIEGMCLGGCQLAHETNGKNNFMCDIYLESTAALINYYYSK